jgi:hypothetical protein
MQFLQAAHACMSAQGISYHYQPGENRTRFYKGSWQGYVCLFPITINLQQS